MPKWVAEEKKKKKQQETPQKSVKSPSVSKNNNASNNARTQKTVDRLSEKYGGGYTRQTPVKRQNPSTARTSANTQERATQTQKTVDRLNQKYGQNRVVREQQERRNTPLSSKAQKTNDRLAEKYGTGKVQGGKHSYMDDVADTISSTLRQTAAAEKRALNSAARGITLKDRDLYATKAEIASADRRTQERDEKFHKQIQKESREMEKLQEGHSYIGRMGLQAVSSTTGMATDLAWGPASLAHMYMRSAATAKGQVKDKVEPLKKKLEESGNYTQAEIDEMFKDVDKWDQANALAQGGIEVLSEKLFGGIGVAKKAVGGSGILDKALGKMTAKMGSKASTGLMGNLLKGTAEEVAEEEVGGPLQSLASNLIYGNKLQAINEDATRRELKAQSDNLRSQIQNEDDARAIAARLSSSEFLESSKQAFLETGASEKDAEELAKKSRDYLTASLSGDTEKMKALQDEMVDKLAGGESSMKEKWTLQDAIDAAVSTSLMTIPTGAPGAVTSAQMGKAYKDSHGMDAVKNLANITRNLDPDKSAKAQAIIDSIDRGEDISGTQVSELIKWSSEAATQTYQREDVKERTASVKMKQERLMIDPAVRNEDGSLTLGEATEERYEQRYDDTIKRIKNLQKIGRYKDIAKEDIEMAADVSTSFLMGTITANQMNELSLDNTGVRTIFHEITGIDLNQFNERDRKGNLLTAESNIAMQEALFAKAADNYVESARIEQENWNDGARGEMAGSFTEDLGEKGDGAAHDALNTVDPRDRSTFMLMGQAIQNVYDYARHTEDSWSDVNASVRDLYPSLDSEALRGVYEAAKQDRIIAETPYYNASVKAGSSVSEMDTTESNLTEYGKLINESGRLLKDSEQATLQALASAFNINIILRPSKDFKTTYEDANGKKKHSYSNGSYNPATATVLLNGGNDMERNIIAIALHEVTHHIKVQAPEEYKVLSDLVRDRWYKESPEGYKESIGRKQAVYKKAVKQDLSEVAALEEVIADSIGEMSEDSAFVEQICREEPSLAQKIINAIKNVLRKIRQALASGRIAPEYEDAFFSQLDIWDETQRAWMQAAKAAQKNRANQMVDEWEAQTRQSIPSNNAALAERDDTAIFIKNTAGANYIDMIFNGEKTEETRTQRTLDKFIGKEVAVTDGKMVYGTVVLGEPHKYTADEFRTVEAQAKHRVPIGDKYDSDKGKWAYPIESATKYDAPRKLSNDKDYLSTRQARQVRYSISDTDSEGNKLSEGQREFFKDSKAVDENGNLLVMYHSTPEEFTVFDSDYLGSTSGDEYENTALGFFVTDNKRFSNRFGENELKLYANITNPIQHPYNAHIKHDSQEDLDAITRKWLETVDPDQLEAYEEALEDDPDLTLYNYYLNLFAFEDPYEGSDYVRDILEEAGYDAVEIFEGRENELTPDNSGTENAVTTYAVFNSNQLKNIDNLNPTEDEDIRYSVQAISNATGLEFRKRGEASVLLDADGNEVNQVTRETVINSPLGHILAESVRKGILPEAVVRNKHEGGDPYDEVDFVVDVMNMILRTQNIDMLYAISGTMGYDPTNLVDEKTPLELLREKGSRFLHIRSNSENQYGTTVDFTTICVKTQAVIDAMSAVMKKRKGGLTKDEVINIVYKEVYNAGEQVPCPVCYVFSRWVGLGGIFDTMRDLQEKFPETMDTEAIRTEFNTVVSKVDRLIAESEKSDKKLKGTKARETYYKLVQDRLNELDQIEFYSGVEALKDKYTFTDEMKAEKAKLTRELELLDAWSWLLNTRLKDTYKPVPLDVLYDINAGKEFAESYPDSWKFRTTRGAGMGKAAVPYTPAILGNTIMGINTGGKVEPGKRSSNVFTDLGKNPFLNPSNEKNAKSIKTRIANAVKKVKAQNIMNGQRLQSTSDFRFEYALDYLLNFLEFSAVGAKAQLYTKVPEAVPFLASTGTECNCSIMAKGAGIVRNKKVGDHYIGKDLLTGEEIETDQEYNLVFSDVTGMAIEDAIAMSQAYDNVQPILVAIGREHLITALANKYITMVIPYHSSGNTLERYQKMMDIVGESVEDRVDFAEYESEHEVKDATEEQLLNRSVRTKILTGKYFVKNSFRKPSEAEAEALKNNEYLRQLFIRFYGKDELGNDAKPDPKFVENFDENGNDADCYHVVLNGSQASVIMPHEYWDKTSTIDLADKQGEAYTKYCESLGYRPVFSGWDSKGKFHEDMDFTKYPGYWKTLIDRCMYNNDGTYHKQQAVRVKDAQLDMINATSARGKVSKPLQVNDPSKTPAIAERIYEQVEEKRAIEAEQEKQAKMEQDIAKGRSWLEKEGVYMESDAEVLAAMPDSRKFSIASDLDEPYMSAVNSGNMEEAKKLVGEAAKKAGYTEKLYHGTRDFGFTQIRTTKLESKSDGGFYEWSPFFAVDSIDVAQTYSSTYEVKRISEANEPLDEERFDQEYSDAVNDLVGAINSFAEAYNYMDYTENQFMAAFDELVNTSHAASDIIGELSDFVILDTISEIAWNKASDYAEANPDEDIDVGEYADEIQEGADAEDIWAKFGAVADLLTAYDNSMYGNSSAGNYELFANTDNVMRIDAKGSKWNSISASALTDVTGDSPGLGDYVNTRNAAAYARDHGFDGIQISNLYDDGGHGNRQIRPATIYIFFKPERQIKSADTITYAEDGSVIPLSERFNPENDDIRYSLPTQDSDGNILSDGQMEYFKNSQARDTDGKLAVVYHTTNYGGFTVFDPSFSDDKRSLFFASNFDVSQTYGRNATEPIDLNVEKPFESYEEYIAFAKDNFTDIGWDADKDLIDNIHLAIHYGTGDESRNNPITDKRTLEAWLNNELPDMEYYWADARVPSEWAGQWKMVDGADPQDLLESINAILGRSEDTQRGYYSTYLNLENPLIVDAHGANWNAIPYSYESDDELERYYSQRVLFVRAHKVKNTNRMMFSVTYEVKDSDGKWGRQILSKKMEADDENNLWDMAKNQFSSWGFSETYWNIIDLQNQKIGEYVADGYDYLTDEGIYAGSATTAQEKYRTRELAELAEDKGHDGVIIRNCRDLGGVSQLKGDPLSDIYIAFSSNQVKDISNTDPTENPDIRYSVVSEDETMAYAQENARTLDDLWFDDPELEEGRVRMTKAKLDFINSKTTTWDARWKTEGVVLNEKKTRSSVIAAIRKAMSLSDTDRQYRTELVDEAMKVCKRAYYLMKIDRILDASDLIYETSRKMIEDTNFFDEAYEESLERYKELRDYFRTTPLKMPEGNEADIDPAFWRNNFGRIWHSNLRGISIDEAWVEMSEKWPEYFSPEETDFSEMFMAIENALDVSKPIAKAYSSEEAADYIDSLANDLYDIVYDGEAYKSVADVYSERADRRISAMKVRFDEAMRKSKEKNDELTNRLKEQRRKAAEDKKQLKAKNERDLKRMQYTHQFEISRLKSRADYERAYLKYQQRKKDAERKERTFHSKYFKSIAKSHKELVDRLRTNTKDKHIPEQYKKELAGLLAAFDLQTVGSKKVEERRGRQAQKTIKMLAIKDALEAIEKKTQLFHVNDSITDIISELSRSESGQSIDGLTIDELNSSQLKRIDKLLKALIHEFNNYESVRVGTKRQQAEDIGSAQVDTCLAHADKFGAGKDYQNLIGQMDKIINLDEVTPAYLFRQIDPDKTGLGLMYGELRRAFGKYTRNQEQLQKWMEEILGEYHKGGKLWNKYGSDQIEQWRSINYAQTFELTNGSVTLTPAQMMSIYCLARRAQAKDHMQGAGIVVKPVSFQAKIMSDLKHKTNWALPIILTDDDITKIVTALSKDQIKVAQKLQELMATKMADWGNEASMSVIGIRLFEDPDYFPIQSDKAALEKDLSEDQFVEAIRSFGFTKAVQPGARNAIAIDDIFTVVAQHCNNMNLYNSYSEAVNDFMKVYNYHALREDGSDYSVEQAVAHAYSQKATSFIKTFMKDLNGNVSKDRTTGITEAINASLANAKKASVFANGRVALQQITALNRAFYVINPKYVKGVHVEKGAMQEMFEHCDIALWKSWGYYDINMGKSIEDVMMNNGNWLDDKMTNIYGTMDNVAWTAIWQMVKAEMKDTHPNVKEGTDEYWELCNERMNEVIDLTQVVDSPFHRSHAMRAKDPLTKMFTAFMAEPTLTFNMVRDGLLRSYEAFKSGKKGEAAKILGRTAHVFVFTAAFTSAAAAIWDAVRGKGQGDDDDDKLGAFQLWWMNCIENFKDNINLFNNIYYVKDIKSLFEGWDQKNLGLQGWKHLADFYNQLTGRKRVFSKLSWYENFIAGLGYLAGLPLKTLMNDGRSIMKLFGLQSNILSDIGARLDAVQDLLSGDSGSSGATKTSSNNGANEPKEKGETSTSVRLWTYEDAPFHVEDGSLADNFLNHFGINLTAAEIDTIEAKKAEEERQEKISKIKEKADGLTGEERDKKVWSAVTTYAKEQNGDVPFSDIVARGNYEEIDTYRKMYLESGGDEEYFDKRVYDLSKKALKKSIVYDPTDEQIQAQGNIKAYLTDHGMTEDEMSEIAYKSDTARELKMAFRLGDKDAMMEELVPLVRAGLTYEDLERLWANRNRVNLKTYKGKYKDRFKSTGTYKWPITGQITSNFGHRSSPGGIGSTNHQGMDIAGSMGDPVGAADGGTVVYAGWYGGAGKTVMIQHDDGTVTQYSHLSWWDVKEGDIVGQGQTIGNVGSTGNSTGPHLHFGVKVNGNYVDPASYLNRS